MSVNFAGFVEIDVQGKPGKQIDFQFSECADKAMTNQLHSQYILGPSGKGTFRNRFELSLLHSSYLHLGLWFVEGLGGIQPDPKQGGFQSFVIRPGIPKTRKADLGWVRAS